MKVIYKQPHEVSQKKKIVDIHKYAKTRNRYFRISILLNIILLGIILAMGKRG